MKFADQFNIDIADHFNDATDFLANHRGMVLDFYHVPSGISVAFKGMINNFSDQYASEWNTETVYGRMDPIPAFQGTARTISLEWDVVAGSIAESKLNMAKCETLMAMLYPTYEKAGNSNTIASSPIFKFKFGNFAQNSADGPRTARAANGGLTGYIAGFTFEPDFESGIIDNPDPKDFGKFYPQRVTLAAEFTVLHTHELGWKKEGSKPLWAENQPGAIGAGMAQSGFPYSTRGASGTGAGAGGSSSTPGVSSMPHVPMGSSADGTDDDGSATGTGTSGTSADDSDPASAEATAHDMGMP